MIVVAFPSLIIVSFNGLSVALPTKFIITNKIALPTKFIITNKIDNGNSFNEPC